MATAPLVPGQMLGKYRIEAEIGRGGMGLVYRAYDPALKRRVAIKVLPPEMTYDQQFVARFQQEAVLAAQLRHPGIVTIHDVGQQAAPGSALHYIVMEYLEGETLQAWLERRGASGGATGGGATGGGVSLQEAAGIIRQVAAALDYAHSRGVIHRDIKPANIMLGPDGRATVMDFGLVRAAEGAGLTRTGMVMGTPEYMSPEQGLGEPADARSDIYSLGVVAYRLLSGKVPFARTTPYATTYAHVNEPPPPLRQTRPDLPAPVETVVNRALAKRREDRYQRAGELADALTAVASGRRTPEPAPSAVREAGPSAVDAATVLLDPTRGRGAAKRGLPTVALALAGAAVVLIVAAVIVLPRLSGRQEISGGGGVSPAASEPLATATLSSDVLANTQAPAPTNTKPAARVLATSVAAAAPEPTRPAPTQPLPTAAPTATTAPTVPMLTARDTVNVRSGPGTTYPRIGSLAAGQALEIKGRNAAGDWWQIAYNGQAGWVAASFVDARLPANASVPVVAAPPTPLPPVQASAVVPLSLGGQANANLRDGYVSPPAGVTNLGGVSFDLGDDGTVTTQASTLPDNPTRVWLPVGRQNVRAVYLLLTGGNTYARFEGKPIGQIRLLFDGRTQTVDLIAGVNVREWKMNQDVVGAVRSASTQQVWQGSSRDGFQAIMDLLRLDVPADLQPLNLQGVEVLDTSASTVGEMDPALNVLGASVAIAQPTPTPPPVACNLAPGPSLAGYWDRNQMGCALGAEASVWTAYEPFERGFMLWRQDVDNLYAFYGGRFQTFHYPSENPPEFWCSDAQAAGNPRRGFSRVWCDSPDVRSQVGAALGRESGENRAVQEFENGFLIYVSERGTAVWAARSGNWYERR